MTLCLNPECGQSNVKDSLQCIACGNPLLLKGRYRALKLLGEGGFGKTFLAVNQAVPGKPPCVIKQFKSQDRPSDFQNEAQKLQQLGENPQIPALLDFFLTQAQTYLVQEYVRGQNLEQALQSRGIFSADEVLNILLELLPVLEEIHQKKIIHRDVKPANIIQSSDGRLVLVDFGASKTLTGTRLIQTGTIIGSACFAAPEQTIGKAIYASDIYSLGVTCIYLLTNISPFTLFDISENQWVWQDYLTQPVPQKLRQVLNKMLQGATKYRYRSCADILYDLNPPLQNYQFSKTPPINKRPAQPQNAALKKAAATSPAPARSNPSPERPLAEDPRVTNPTLLKFRLDAERTYREHLRSIHAVALSPNRKHIASADSAGYVYLWDANSPQPRKTLMKGEVGSFDCVCFSPSNAWVAAGGWDGDLRIWNVQFGNEVAKLPAHKNTINSVKFSPDGQWLATGGYDGAINLWKKGALGFLGMMQWKTHNVWVDAHEGWVTDIQFSPDSRYLVSTGWNGTAKLWDIEAGKVQQVFDNKNVMMMSVCFHPNGDKIATAGGNDRAVTLWDCKTGERIRTMAGRSFLFTQAQFLPNGKHVIASCSDGQVRVLNLAQGGCVSRTFAHQKKVTSIVMSDNGRLVVTGSADKTVKVWSIQKHV